MRHPLFKFWRSLVHSAGFLLLLSVALVSTWCLCGCPSDTARQTLAAVTRATTASLPMVYKVREADGARCFEGAPTYDEAAACLARVDADWAPVWLALDALEAADQSALDGKVDIAATLGVFCGLVAVLNQKGVGLPTMGLCQ